MYGVCCAARGEVADGFHNWRASTRWATPHLLRVLWPSHRARRPNPARLLGASTPADPRRTCAGTAPRRPSRGWPGRRSGWKVQEAVAHPMDSSAWVREPHVSPVSTSMLIAIVMRWTCSGRAARWMAARSTAWVPSFCLPRRRAAPLGGGRLVVEDEVLVRADPALCVGEEEREVGVSAGEAERDGQPFPCLVGQCEVLPWHERRRGSEYGMARAGGWAADGVWVLHSANVWIR